jgi:hypothetical protein
LYWKNDFANGDFGKIKNFNELPLDKQIINWAGG